MNAIQNTLDGGSLMEGAKKRICTTDEEEFYGS